MHNSMGQAAVCPRRGWLQKQGLAEDAQAAVCNLWWTPRVWVRSWWSRLTLQPLQQLQQQGHFSVPCFHFRNPFLHCSVSLFASWDALASILNMSSFLELFFFLRRLDKYLLNDNSSPVLSCHELSAVGGKEKMSYCKNDAFMPTGTKSMGCSPFPLCFSFLVLPSLGDSKTFSKSFASEEQAASVYLEERSLEKFSANQAHVRICSYRACCGKRKTMVHAEARWCLFAHRYWLSLLQQVSLFQKVWDKQSCCTGVEGHDWLWMVPSVMSHFARTALLCVSLP